MGRRGFGSGRICKCDATLVGWSSNGGCTLSVIRGIGDWNRSYRLGYMTSGRAHRGVEWNWRRNGQRDRQRPILESRRNLVHIENRGGGGEGGGGRGVAEVACCRLKPINMHRWERGFHQGSFFRSEIVFSNT